MQRPAAAATWIASSARACEQAAVEGEEGERVENLAGAVDQNGERKSRVVGCGGSRDEPAVRVGGPLLRGALNRFQERPGRADREAVRELEKVPISGHEHRALRFSETEEVVVAGIR